MCVLLCLVAISANAQVGATDFTPPIDSAAMLGPTNQTAAAGAGFGGFLAGLESVVSKTIAKVSAGAATNMFQTGVSIGASTTSAAASIAGALSLVYLAYSFIVAMGEGRPNMIAILIDVGIPAAIAGLLIVGYSGYINSAKAMFDIFASVGTDPIPSISSFFTDFVKMIGAAMLDALKAVLAVPFGNFSGLGYAVMDCLAVYFIAIPALILVLLCLAEIFTLILMGPFLLAIGVAFGPLLIAGIVTPWTRNYFTTWLNFLVGAAVLTGVVRIIMQIGATLMSAFSMGSVTTNDPAALQVVIALVLIIAVNALLAQAPSIASALVPGTLGTRGELGKGMTSAVKDAHKQNVGGLKGAVAGVKLGGAAARGTGRLIRAVPGASKALGQRIVNQS